MIRTLFQRIRFFTPGWLLNFNFLLLTINYQIIRGRDHCPFGANCFYKHALPDGTIISDNVVSTGSPGSWSRARPPWEASGQCPWLHQFLHQSELTASTNMLTGHVIPQQGPGSELSTSGPVYIMCQTSVIILHTSYIPGVNVVWCTCGWKYTKPLPVSPHLIRRLWLFKTFFKKSVGTKTALRRQCQHSKPFTVVSVELLIQSVSILNPPQ